MIDSIEINNFRCFEAVELEDLGRVNLIVGDMSSGKTALLEALYLVAGNSPENHLKLGAWRGLRGEKMAFSQEDVGSGELWRDLFHGFDLDKRVTIAVKGTTNRLLVIAKDSRPTGGVFTEGAILRSPVSFTWYPHSGKAKKCVPSLHVDENRLEFPNTPSGIGGAMLVGRVPAAELAAKYSDLDKANRVAPVLDALCTEFQDVEGLSVQVDRTAGQILYASLASLQRKIPLGYVSAGINRLVYILTSVASYPGGAIFIDEMENGIYCERLPSVWAAIDKLSKEAGTQLFVSTHSDEAIDALRPILLEDKGDYRLIRVRKGERGSSDMHITGGQNILSAIDREVDVR